MKETPRTSRSARQDRLARLKAHLKPSDDPDIIRVSTDRSSFPLSTAQQRLWFLEQAAPGSLAYQVPAVIEILGKVRADILENCIRDLIQRHEALRARFTLRENDPISEICTNWHFTLTQIRIDSEEDEEARQKGLLAITDCVRDPFDLETAPLFRVMLVQLSEEHYFLAFVFHHIICEAWSISIFLRELEALYGSRLSGQEVDLPALTIQFGDFARWERQSLESGSVKKHIDYWAQKLRGLPTLELPTDRARPPIQTQNGAILSRTLPRSLKDAIEALARELNTTPFVITLSAFFVLLHRYTGQRQIAVGTPVSNRDRADLQGVFGFFVNTLVYRCDISSETTFTELAHQIRENVLDSFSHQNAPFETIVDALQIRRDVSRNPLFQAMFAFQNTPMPNLNLAGTRSARVLSHSEVHSGTSRVDLSILVEPLSSEWSVWVEFNSDLFDAARIQRLLGHYEMLLSTFTLDPKTRLSLAPLLTESEQEEILIQWNDTTAEIPEQSVVELFQRCARETPNKIALRSTEGNLTYGDLDERSDHLAGLLRTRGVESNSIVALFLDRSFELVISQIAVLKAGGAYAPIDPTYPAERAEFLIKDTNCSLCITRSSESERISSNDLFLIDEVWSTADPRDMSTRREASVDADRLAYVIYTSGSTGTPKGVEITERGLRNLVSWHHRAYAITPEDTATMIASPAFDASVWETWPYLTSGAAIAIPDEETRLSPEKLLAWLVKQDVTISFLPTPLASAILRLSWPPSTQLRALLTGGDVLLPVDCSKIPFRLYNHYGPTENTVVTTATEVTSNGTVAPPIGRPIANTEAYILDENLQPVPVGVTGELCVTGAGLARGYHGRADLTRQSFVPNPVTSSQWPRLYKTGDLCHFLEDGSIQFEGRRDTQVKVRGIRVELGEIESIISQTEGIRECAVALRAESQSDQQMLVAYIVAVADRGNFGVRELRKALASRLPQYMIPHTFVSLPELPKTTNGKIDRRALPDATPTDDSGHVHVAPETEIEKLLASIWSEVLGMNRIGADDNFFELGGNSLLAVRVTQKVRELCGIRVSPLVLFTGSLRQTAEAIDNEIAPQSTTSGRFGFRSFVDKVAQNIARLTQ